MIRSDGNPTYCLPDVAGVLAFRDPGGGNGELLTVPIAGGPALTVLSSVKSLDRVTRVGSDLALCVRRSTSGDPSQLLRLPQSLGSLASVVVNLGPDCETLRLAASDDGTVALLVDCTGQQWLGRTNLSAGGISILTSQPLDYGPMLAITPSGSVAAAVELPAASVVFDWAKNGEARVLLASPGGGHVLPPN